MNIYYLPRPQGHGYIHQQTNRIQSGWKIPSKTFMIIIAISFGAISGAEIISFGIKNRNR